MDAKNMIRQSIEMSDMVFGKYLDDLDDEAFRACPAEGMNPIAWQLGHLIVTERALVEEIQPGSCPPLPEGFEAKHPRKPEEFDCRANSCTKDEYLGLWKAQRDASKALLETFDEADLDAPAPEAVRPWCPTVAHALNMMSGLHPMMHAGQFVAVRRSLGKPIAL